MSKLEKLFHLMKDSQKRTSLDMQDHIISVAIGSMVADLRKKSCHIPPAKFIGVSKTGAMIYEYVMLSWPKGLYSE